MSSMPVAAGMDAMQEEGKIVGMSTAPSDTSAYTHMRADGLAPLDTPDMSDWDQDEGSDEGNAPVGHFS